MVVEHDPEIIKESDHIIDLGPKAGEQGGQLMFAGPYEALLAETKRRGGPNEVFTALRSPDDLLVVAAGGPAGGFGAVIPPWLGSKAQAVTQAIELPATWKGC